MNWTTGIRCGLAVLLCAGTFASPSGEGSGDTVIGVCSAIGSSNKGKIKLRGIGRGSADGFVLFDHTCPVIEDVSPPIPGAVLLKVSPNNGTVSELLNTHSLHAAVVEGNLRCVDRVRISPNTVVGNGYGAYGRIPCELSVGKLLVLEPWR